MKITASLSTTSTGCDTMHEVDEDQVAAMVEIARDAAAWPFGPVLVVADNGNGPMILDGHHRVATAQAIADDPNRNYEAHEIPAYVIDRDEFEDLIKDEFDGDVPTRLCDLDEYIDADGSEWARD